MSKDIRKSVSRLAQIVTELQKGENGAAKDGHATIASPIQGAKPHQVSNAPQIPIAKAGAKSSLPQPKHSVPAAKKTQPVKHIKNSSKEKAYMKVQKAIVLIGREQNPAAYPPMSDDFVVKSFGHVPEAMKHLEGRPTEDWWDRCIGRANSLSDNPTEFVSCVWYGDVMKGIMPHPTKEDLKWLPDALSGGGFNSLRNHPKAGQFIKGCAGTIGKSVLGRSDTIQKSGISDLDPEEIGFAVLEALDEMINTSADDKMQKAWNSTLGGLISKGLGQIAGAGLGGLVGGPVGAVVGGAAGEAAEDSFDKSINAPAAVAAAGKGINEGMKEYNTLTQKAVAEPIGSKYSPKPRESKLGKDYDGESAVSGDGTKANVQDLAGKSEVIKDI